MLKMELGIKGVKEVIILGVIESEYGSLTESEVAGRLARRKLDRYSGDPVKAPKRIADFLLRRGFSWDIINPIIRDIRNEEIRKY